MAGLGKAPKNTLTDLEMRAVLCALRWRILKLRTRGRRE